jgi:endonuclease/exonuclease/phosphatase family metal-dependent hydrolase
MLKRRVWFILVALVIAVPGTTSATAGHRREVDVMTYNVFLGGDLTPVLTASTPEEVVAAATTLYQQVVTTDFPERARSIAKSIDETDADLVGLQEVTLWRTDTPADGPATPATEVAFDFLDILLDALAERGLHYEPVSVVENFDGEAPTALGFDVRLTDRDVILVRGDLPKSQLKITNEHHDNFEAMLEIPNAVLGTIEVLRGWNTVDVKVRGKSFRFINTHLEAFSPEAQVAQAQELLAGPAATSMPVVMVGDFNSNADGSTTPTYGMLVAGGFTDAWTEARPDDPGNGCCWNSDLVTGVLDHRIDLILFRGGGFAATSADLLGEEASDLTPSGLHPSDHSGVVAELEFGPGAPGH